MLQLLLILTGRQNKANFKCMNLHFQSPLAWILIYLIIYFIFKKHIVFLFLP